MSAGKLFALIGLGLVIGLIVGVLAELYTDLPPVIPAAIAGVIVALVINCDRGCSLPGCPVPPRRPSPMDHRAATALV